LVLRVLTVATLLAGIAFIAPMPAYAGVSIGVTPTSYGWLSYADDRIARWDAQPLDLHIECPVEWLACPTGGGRGMAERPAASSASRRERQPLV
jgi:hypothetical protein